MTSVAAEDHRSATRACRAGPGTDPALVDLLVIGGGPGGIAAAVAAARAGASVLLVDRGRFPRPKVCGGCLNARGVGVLERLGLADTLRDAPATDRFELAMNGRRLHASLPPGRAISRLAWDERMVAAAEAAGVQVLTETTARVLPSEPGSVRTVTLDGPSGERTASARLVAAADGLTQSATRSEPSLRTQAKAGSRIGAGALLPPDSLPSGTLRPGTIAMAAEATGYVGLVRVERNRVNVAAAMSVSAVRGRTLAEATAAILATAGHAVPDGWHEADWTGTPPLTRSAPAGVASRLGCVGDAAGYVEPFTGEGMTWALAAGEAFGRRVPQWCDDPAAMARMWPAEFARVVSQRQRVCQALAWLLKRPRLARLAFPVAGPLVGPASRLINRT